MKTNGENGSGRRQAILDAAEKVFGACGYSATTMEAVADAAGISKGSVYNYFKSKDDLFESLLEQVVIYHKQASREFLTGPGPASEKMEKLLDYYFQRFAEFRPMLRLVMEFWATAARQQQEGELSRMLREQYVSWRQEVMTVLEAGVAAGEFSANIRPQVAASLILAELDGIQVQSMFDIGLNVNEELVDGLKSAILASLCQHPVNKEVILRTTHD